jgi:hypothetical protein
MGVDDHDDQCEDLCDHLGDGMAFDNNEVNHTRTTVADGNDKCHESGTTTNDCKEGHALATTTGDHSEDNSLTTTTDEIDVCAIHVRRNAGSSVNGEGKGYDDHDVHDEHDGDESRIPVPTSANDSPDWATSEPKAEAGEGTEVQTEDFPLLWGNGPRTPLLWGDGPRCTAESFYVRLLSLCCRLLPGCHHRRRPRRMLAERTTACPPRTTTAKLTVTWLPRLMTTTTSTPRLPRMTTNMTSLARQSA